MHYRLTLTSGERRAFDWIGDRYATGDDMVRAIMIGIPDDREWSDDGEITFDLPEYAAWMIRDLSNREHNQFPCFSRQLRNKLQTFLDRIV